MEFSLGYLLAFSRVKFEFEIYIFDTSAAFLKDTCFGP